MRLGELLIEAGAVTADQVDAALREQRRFGGRLGTNLIDLGFVTEASMTKVLAAQLHLPRISEAALEKIPRGVLDLLKPAMAAAHAVCPVRIDGARLHLAMSDPLDRAALEAIQAHTKHEIRPLVAGDGDIRHALQRHYGVIPKPRAVRIRSEASLPVLHLGDDSAYGEAPVFDPYTIALDDARLGSISEAAENPPPVAVRPPPPKPRASPPPPPPSAPRAPVAAPRPADLRAALAAAQTFDDVGELIARGVGKDFTRSALLLVRGDRLVGWRADGPDANSAGVRAFALPLSAVPGLARALEAGAPVFTRAPALVLPFLSLLGDPAGQPAMLLPIRHDERAAVCVVAVGGQPDVERRADEYAALAQKFSLALRLIMIRRQILDLG